MEKKMSYFEQMNESSLQLINGGSRSTYRAGQAFGTAAHMAFAVAFHLGL